MPIVFNRVEERLIHGQVAYAWGTALDFEYIVVVDDSSASDILQRSLLEMACPKGKKVLIISEEEAIKQLGGMNNKLFVIAKSPITFMNLVDGGVEISELNIGSVHYKPDKKEIHKAVYLSVEEIAAVKKLMESGVEVTIQKLPTESVVKVKEIL